MTLHPGLCRIRKTTLEGCTVSVIGQNVDLTYPYNYLGEGAADLGQALKDESFMQSFQEAKYPVVLVGPGILQRADRDTILQQVSTQQHKPVPSESVLNSQDTVNDCLHEGVSVLSESILSCVLFEICTVFRI